MSAMGGKRSLPTIGAMLDYGLPHVGAKHINDLITHSVDRICQSSVRCELHTYFHDANPVP